MEVEPEPKLTLQRAASMERRPNFRVLNPFNLIYQKSLQNILNHRWEIRHASALILRALLQGNVQFLGFAYPLPENLFTQQKDFSSLLSMVRDQFRHFVEQEKNLHDKIDNFISRNMIVVALDRFADFVSDTSNIIVRDTSCQILSQIIQKQLLPPPELDKLMNMLNVFLRQKEWEVIQNSLYLIKYIMQLLPAQVPHIFEKFSGDLL